ncbi:hypothetical protein [Mycobacterium sp. UM_CSW]|uniref:hypothetical protein n=1 Tax=Mycobacterium sp. UM_CSW TaxID=1370119 RepID=UPI001267ADDF|nr:hypothetical protein [Mycobacterium sp. UM_CSW]
MIQTAVPQTLTANLTGVQLARAASQTWQDPASPTEGDARLLNLARNRSNNDVLHLDPGLITYDNFSRPIIINPFGAALHIFWQLAGGAIREIVIPALGQIITEISQAGPNPVIAILPGETGEPDKVTAAVINGGGRDPGPDQLPPPPPPAPTEVPNTCVAVRYTNAQYQPFIVSKIVDLGNDQQYGEHKVLLDGVTPAWGEWTQSPDCGPQFEVHKTQSLPGVDEPKQVPLAGGYPMHPTSPSSSSESGFLVVLAALIIAALILGAVLAAITRTMKKPSPNPDELPEDDSGGQTQHPHIDTRVRADARPGDPPVITTRDAPVRGGVMHAIRLEAHSDPGTATMREVDHDVSRIG